MQNKQFKEPVTNADEHSFDDLMASYFVLVTHHSLTQSDSSLPLIVERLQELFGHSELEFYPEQKRVIAKMKHLWSTRLFNIQLTNGIKH